MSSNDSVLEQYFGYLPNLPLAVISTVAYFLVSLPLFYQSYKYQNKLTYVLPITGLVESAGYTVRLIMIDHASLNVYVVMGLLIILAPNALAFANYKVLGHIIEAKAVHLRLPSAVGGKPRSSSNSQSQSTQSRFRIPYLMNEYGEVHGNRLATFFFLSDIAAILLQGSGGGMQGSGNATLGTDVLLFGLASQLFFFAIFTALAIYVYASPLYQEVDTNIKSDDDSTVTAQEYKRAFYGLFGTIGMLYARNIYRVIEFAMGYHGYLATTELFMYLFDTLFIFIAFLMYIYFNFAGFLTKTDKQMERERGMLSEVAIDSLRKPTEQSESSPSESLPHNTILVNVSTGHGNGNPYSTGSPLV